VASTLRVTLLYLLNNPHTYITLQRELDAAFAAGRISNPITDAEARSLPYLQAVIREGMRVFPGVTPPLYKTAPASGDEIAGYRIPPGTQVGTNVFGIARSKRYWGNDADLFRPERWLEVKDEKTLERMREVAESQFGFGRYKCLGRPLAFLEMNKLLPEVSYRVPRGWRLPRVCKRTQGLTSDS
jgi:cytochrome P450